MEAFSSSPGSVLANLSAAGVVKSEPLGMRRMKWVHPVAMPKSRLSKPPVRAVRQLRKAHALLVR